MAPPMLTAEVDGRDVAAPGIPEPAGRRTAASRGSPSDRPLGDAGARPACSLRYGVLGRYVPPIPGERRSDVAPECTTSHVSDEILLAARAARASVGAVMKMAPEGGSSAESAGLEAGHPA